MSFMKPEIWQDRYYLIETRNGTEVVQCDTIGLDGTRTAEEIAAYLDCDHSEILSVEYIRSGWLYRLSAPGYLDCTETGSAETEAEAIKAILDLYGNDDGEPEDWEEELRERLQELSR